MAKKATNNEINEIKEDIHSLKENVVSLTKTLKNKGSNNAITLQDTLNERFETLKENGKDQIVRAEKQVQEHPGKSLALAFGAGLIASYFFNRK